jgi:hypothetical protein
MAVELICGRICTDIQHVLLSRARALWHTSTVGMLALVVQALGRASGQGHRWGGEPRVAAVAHAALAWPALAESTYVQSLTAPSRCQPRQRTLKIPKVAMVRLSERSHWREQSMNESFQGSGLAAISSRDLSMPSKRRKRKPARSRNPNENYSPASSAFTDGGMKQSRPRVSAQISAQEQRTRLADAIGRLLSELQATIAAGQVSRPLLVPFRLVCTHSIIS